MSKFLSFLFGVLGVVAVAFGWIILHVVLGAIVGWAVGLVFAPAILDTLSRFGVNTWGLETWQLGATFAFIGAFFRSNTINHKSK